MIHEIILPMLGETMDEGQITSWRKAEGDKVTKGEPLFEVTTDKAAFEAESPADGYLRKILIPASDQQIPVAKVIGYIADSMDEPLPDTAEELAGQGIDVEIVDLRTLLPLDVETIVESVRKTSRAVIVEEDTITAGAGAEIGMRIMEEAFDYLDAPVKRVAGANVPMPKSSALEKLAIPSKESSVRGIREVLP